MTPPEPDRSSPWWAGAVIYQVYPRSFADSNGDGIGDLEGLITRLDHLAGTDASLGVDAVWLSPIYPSPLADFGYDISDFTGVAPEFGTLADLDRLVEACHARGLRLLLDMVPCHTSVQHPWFVESRSSRTSARRDWYTWADPGPGGGPPSNWRASFGGSAWELDPASGQYYLHSFYPESTPSSTLSRTRSCATTRPRGRQSRPSRPIATGRTRSGPSTGPRWPT